MLKAWREIRQESKPTGWRLVPCSGREEYACQVGGQGVAKSEAMLKRDAVPGLPGLSG